MGIRCPFGLILGYLFHIVSNRFLLQRRAGTISRKVKDLIDVDYKDWLQPVVIELFSSTEADCILRIPLSLRSTEDRLIWH